MDYFTLFGLPLRYQLDLKQLSIRYQQLQRQFHPDGFTLAPEREKREAIQQSAIINDAYQTLKDPINRAEHLLSLQGVQLDNEQCTITDSEFLQEQLALREELEQIAQQEDAAAALLVFSIRVDKITHLYTQQLQQLLDDEQWASASETVQKLRFLTKLTQQIAQLEQKMLGG